MMDDATLQQLIRDARQKANALNKSNPIQMRLTEIIDALNDIRRGIEDAGECIIDCVIDEREADGLPPFSPEELAAASADCDRIAGEVLALEGRERALIDEYFEIAGCTPHYHEGTQQYARRWRSGGLAADAEEESP